MGQRERGADEGEPSRMPLVYLDLDDQPHPDTIERFALEVDDERFAVSVARDPATGYTDASYTWLSGPNKGYGFGIGGPPEPPSREAHRQRIREFLAMVDPTTGYIEDD